MIAFVGVLVIPTLEALAVAVIVSLVLVVWRASEARLTFLGRPQGHLEPVELGTERTTSSRPSDRTTRRAALLRQRLAVRDGILAAVAHRDPDLTWCSSTCR